MTVLGLRGPFRTLTLLLALFGAPSLASASNCDFRVKSITGLEDATTLGVLRCLVTQLDRLQRENAALKRRVAEIEGLLGQLPAAYSNIDGVITQEQGRKIGKASFVLSARSTGGANALPVDQAVLEEVCGAKGGCAVSVAFRQIGLFNDTPKDSVLTGPCQFAYDPKDRDWTLSEGCGTPQRSGVDGDRFADRGEIKDPVIASSGGACLFSESEPDRAIGGASDFQQDESPGLFLVAMPARQTNGIRRFQCELVLN